MAADILRLVTGSSPSGLLNEISGDADDRMHNVQARLEQGALVAEGLSHDPSLPDHTVHFFGHLATIMTDCAAMLKSEIRVGLAR